MSKTLSNAIFMLIGSVATCAVLMFLGASHPPADDSQYQVDFDTFEFNSKQLAIEITDSSAKKAYLYVVPQPTKMNLRGDSPVVEFPPSLVATIDLNSAGNETLDAKINNGFLPVHEVPATIAPPTQPKVPNFELRGSGRE